MLQSLSPVISCSPSRLQQLGRTCLQLLRHHSSDPKKEGAHWQWLASQGHTVNPCHSPIHPAVTQGGLKPDSEVEICVQEAYTPQSDCFGCGPLHEDGLHIKSWRIDGGLEAKLRISSKYCAFPGIVNGGVVTTILDCHGNWTAAIALMDRSCLPKPPLTLTASMFVQYKEPTPPDTDLLVISKVMGIKEANKPGMGKATVEVDVSIFEVMTGDKTKLLVHGTGIFKRMGALRVM